MTEVPRIKRISAGSSLVIPTAHLHARCLSETITSKRGAMTLAGIYERLLHNRHAIYVAIHQGRVVGGIVILEHQRSRATLFMLTHRPQSWVTAVCRLGITAFFGQLFDVLEVQRMASRLPMHDYISAVYVDPTTRRIGIARALLGCAMKSAEERNVALAVDTLQTNLGAQMLYANLGFTEGLRTRKSVMFISGSE